MDAAKHPFPKFRRLLTVSSPTEQAEKLKVICCHMNSLEKHKAELESLILEIAKNYLPQIELLLTVPGIHDAFTAIRILAEIGAEMSVLSHPSAFALGKVLLRKMRRALARRKPSCRSQNFSGASLYHACQHGLCCFSILASTITSVAALPPLF